VVTVACCVPSSNIMGAMTIEVEEKIDSSRDVFSGYRVRMETQETGTLTPYLYSPGGEWASYASSENTCLAAKEVIVTGAITSSPSSKPSCDLSRRHFPVAKLDLLLATSSLASGPEEMPAAEMGGER
jgi:hypothetical protein